MTLARLPMLLALVLVAAIGCSRGGPSPEESSGAVGATSKPNATEALKRGVTWLLSQQGADGGWHSATYGQMQCGVGDTALVLSALSHAPQGLREGRQRDLERGLEFLLANLDAKGFVRSPQGSTDYPTYATALTLSSLERLQLNRWPEERKRMQDYLLAAQQTGQHGWSADDVVFGGWTHAGGDLGRAVSPGEVNLAVTTFVLEALQAVGGLNDGARQAASAYVARCQNFGPEADGGFFFTTAADDPLNKAGYVERDGKLVPNSYGTTTTDGILALAALGTAADEARLPAATAWLARQDTAEHVPGIPQEDAEMQFRDALKFYYWAGLARVAQRFPSAVPAKIRAQVVATLVETQTADGSWKNPCPLMREDDPLVATSLAVMALSLWEQLPTADPAAPSRP